MSLTQTVKDNLSLRRWSGPLTDRLEQKPGLNGMGRMPLKTQADATTSSICGFCSTGCSLKIHLKDGEAVNLSATENYPVNLGMACPKGWEALAPLEAPDRATSPQLRADDGSLRDASWDEAMKAFVSNFKSIQEQHGPESLAFLSTGQIASEEMAFLGSLAKFGIGMRHGDGNTRQCMATSVVAYKQSFGFDAPPYTYKDFEESDVLVFVGANPCIAHPIMWQRVMSNPNNPAIIVVDPRKTETAMAATHHYALQPKSDLVLFYGLARLLIEQDNIDRYFIEQSASGFSELAAFLVDFPLNKVTAATGLAEEQLHSFANLIANGKRVSFWWTMGVNQSYEGVRVAQSLINLALLTGNIGRPGTGANSITGQCNAMGSRLFSNTTSLLGGHDFANPEHRSKISRILDIPAKNIPQENSWAYDQILEGVERGKIKGLWVIATNTAHSWINQKRFRRIREKLDYFIVQDMYSTTDTAKIADLVLPAAGWGEKDGTFINSERRIGRIRKVRKAPGQALADFHIFRLVAQYWGCGELFSKWDSPEAVFRLLQKVSEGQPCDISGIDGYNSIEKAGGIQWPYPKGSQRLASERRLFADGRFYHADGKARFIFSEPTPMPEPPDEAYPFLLLTGRGTSAQWHTQTRTEKSDVLQKLYPKEAYIEVNPADAEKLGFRNADRVRVISRRAAIEVVLFATQNSRPGQAFMPMHYPETNLLTHASFDPYSRQPSYKASAVRIMKVE